MSRQLLQLHGTKPLVTLFAALDGGQGSGESLLPVQPGVHVELLDWPQSLLAIAFTLKHARALEYVQTVLVLLIYHNRDMADDDINIFQSCPSKV